MRVAMSALAVVEWPCRIVTVVEELCTTGLCVIRRDEVHVTRRIDGVRLRGEFDLARWLAARRPAGVLPLEAEGNGPDGPDGTNEMVSRKAAKGAKEEEGVRP